MKILVPTDFSNAATTALRYALNIFRDKQVEIIIFHLVYNSAPPKASAAIGEALILEAIMDKAKEEMEKLMTQFAPFNAQPILISSELIKGFPLEKTLLDYAYQKNVDLIVMGTEGASGAKKIFMGTNTAGVINKSDVPVIVVPEHVEMKPVRKIVYASDLNFLSEELNRLIRFAEYFNSDIHVFHVVESAGESVQESRVILNSFRKEKPALSLTWQLNEHGEISVELNKCIREVNGDLLAMFNHELNFIEKIFGLSTTREMAFHPGVPLLVVKQNKESPDSIL